MQNKYIKRIVLTSLALFSVVSLVGCSNPEPETVFYNGIELNKDDLSMETLQWWSIITVWMRWSDML